MSMGPTWVHIKLFTRNFSEADTCTVWNYTITPTTGQKENANDWQAFEHREKMMKFPTKKNRPKIRAIWPLPPQSNIALQSGFKQTVSTSHIQSRSRAAHAYEAARRNRNLNIARSAGPWWMFTSQTRPNFSLWGNLDYHKISSKFQLFHQIFKFSCPWA